MVYYKPIIGINEIKRLFPDKQIDSKSIYGSYTAIENNNEIGKILIRLEGYESEILSICADKDDKLTVEGLIRAALNFAANRNAYISKCFLDEYKDTLLLLGYKNDSVCFSGEIPELLKGLCCKGN